MGLGEEELLDLGEFRFAGRAQVDIHPGAGRDDVDALAALDPTDIEGRPRRGGGRIVCEVGDDAPEGVDRVHDAEVAPAVAAGPVDADPVASRSECLVGEPLDPGAVKGDEAADAASEQALREEVTNTAQIALALLSDRGDEGERSRGNDRGLPQRLDQRRQQGEPRDVIPDPGRVEPLPDSPHGDIGASREDGVEVGREDQPGRFPRRLGSGKESDDVADLVPMDPAQPQLTKSFFQIGAARLFSKWRRGNLADPDLLFGELLARPLDPGERAGHRRIFEQAAEQTLPVRSQGAPTTSGQQIGQSIEWRQAALLTRGRSGPVPFRRAPRAQDAASREGAGLSTVEHSPHDEWNQGSTRSTGGNKRDGLPAPSFWCRTEDDSLSHFSKGTGSWRDRPSRFFTRVPDVFRRVERGECGAPFVGVWVDRSDHRVDVQRQE